MDPFVRRAISGVRRQLESPRGRFFLYLHILPPHSPYVAPAEFARPFAATRPPTYWQGTFPFPELLAKRDPRADPDSWVEWGNKYDANLRWADTAVGALVRELRAAGLLDRTLLVVTADHGEAMREHGYGFHSDVPYDEVLHIPLLIHFPGGRGPHGRVEALTQTIDVPPTLLDLLQVPYPQGDLQGRSLVPLLAGEVRRVNDFLFSRVSPPGETGAAWYVVRDATATLLLHRGGQPRALYDMDADPYQTRNVAVQQPTRAAALVRAFETFAKAQRYSPLDFLGPNYRPPAAKDLPTQKMSEEMGRQLKDLGYVE